MKKVSAALLMLGLSLPVMSPAAEFQPLGTVGIGGAGVARTTDASAAYWNPAGLAFYQKPFSAKLKAGAGVNINSSLAENVDKLGKMDINDLRNLSFSTTSLDTAANLTVSAQAVEFIGIVNDLDHHHGTLAVTPGGQLALQYRNFGVGVFAGSELGAYELSDTANVRPGDPALTSISTFATGIGAAAGRPAIPLFTAAQYSQITTAFQTSGATAGQATAITDTLERQLTATGGNKSGQSAQQLAAAMTHMAQSFAGGGSIEQNKTSIELRGLLLAEIPIAYGYKFDLGTLGQIGVGGAVKIMQGTAFASSEQVVTIKDSGDIVKKITDKRTDSINFGVDVGVLWRYADMLNVGLVAKNLNSPEFDVPLFTPVDANVAVNRTIKVEPQIRFGAALEPLSWLTLAADCDLTSNKTVLPGRESQNLGGGVDIHPLGWLALRLGMYANLAETSAGPVGTFGLSLGPQWLRLDLDGAMAFESAKYKDSSYPREAKVEFGLSTMF